MGFLLLLFCFIAHLHDLVHGVGLLFPHMAGNGDTQLVPELDNSFVNVQLNDNYWFYDDPFNDVYVSTNGYVTRNTGLTKYVPHPMLVVTYWPSGMIAPLFSDILLDDQPPNNNIWYRETQDQAMLNKSRDAIQPYFLNCGGPQFDPTSLFIVTWQRVKPFCESLPYYDYTYHYYDDGLGDNDHCYHYYLYYPFREANELNMRDPPQQPAKPSEEDMREQGDVDGDNIGDRNHMTGINGFQLVLATDGHLTFAIFNMHTIEWTCCWEMNTSGFSAGDYVRSCDLPGSGDSTIDQLTNSTNVALTGRWIYRVDTCEVHDPQCNVCN